LETDLTVPGATIYAGDLCNPAQILDIVSAVQPSSIFHMAAIIDPQATVQDLNQVNVLGTCHLLEAARLSGADPVILIAGSSAVYGRVEPGELPIRESQPFRPLSAYAVSKIAQEMVGYMYHAQYGMKVLRTRTFNLIGPGQPSGWVCAAFARQIAELEAAQAAPTVHFGNLTPLRDFVDVRDAVQAYRLVGEKGRPGQVYNVCSGRGVAIRDCLDVLVRMSRVPVKIEPDPRRMREAEVPISIGDGTLLRDEVGWHSSLPLQQSLADILQDWRRRVQEG
jgi:GDP-4-dehydro-6-deoxy-D-mannose reductase